MTAPSLGRRRVLGAGAALAASTVAGCSGIAPGASAGRVVVVGGGFGGATAARYLKLWGGAGVDVTLVERNAAFVSCPLSNLVLGGYRQMADITLGYDGLRATGVKLLHDEAVAVDVPARKLRLADGSALRYERLVLSPGVDFMPEAIAGLGAALDSGRGLHSLSLRPRIAEYLHSLAARLRGTRVACGDWSRVCGDSVTWRHGTTGVFLDPPYAEGNQQYAAGGTGTGLSAEVRAWAIEAGKRPDMRVVLAGLDGEHQLPASWRTVPWKAHGGYGSQGATENLNRHREVLWLSPACLDATRQPSLFGGAA